MYTSVLSLYFENNNDVFWMVFNNDRLLTFYAIVFFKAKENSDRNWGEVEKI